MKTLAIETAFRPGSVALLVGGQVVGQRRLPSDQPTARVLLPITRDLLRQAGWSPGQVELFAASRGPGSFTGLRIGLTMAKVFAHAVGCHLLGVDTLQLLAWQAGPVPEIIQCVLSAQRQELHVGTFSWSAEALPCQRGPRQLLSVADWLRQVPREARVTGPPLEHLPRGQLPAGQMALATCWEPQAAGVGQLAWRLFRQRGGDDRWQLAPDYGRPSAAEERR